ncbi:endonuclease [uncultured Gilliamella sp.]|uniref:endonuclease n=1 Tax=uncultured Gilliamella sp. TaxID=1193505 RepID=UPI0025F2689C|nr:endonuclease [uncultured Gilliamella sp.]
MIIFTLEHNQYGSCSIAVDFKNRKFQPSIEIEGTIARTYLYMADKYGITLLESEKKLMKEWNQLILPTQRECRRHGPIERLQGNEREVIL